MYNYKAEMIRVVDANTIDLLVDLGFNIKVKIRVCLLDVNAPEIHGVKHDSAEYKQGIAATNYVLAWFEDATALEVRTKKTGKCGRWLGNIYKSVHSVNPTLTDGEPNGSVPIVASLNVGLKGWLEEQDKP